MSADFQTVTHPNVQGCAQGWGGSPLFAKLIKKNEL